MGLKNNLEPDEFLLNNFEDARKSGTLISCLTEIESLNEKMNRSEDFGNFVNDFFEKSKMLKVFYIVTLISGQILKILNF